MKVTRSWCASYLTALAIETKKAGLLRSDKYSFADYTLKILSQRLKNNRLRAKPASMH